LEGTGIPYRDNWDRMIMEKVQITTNGYAVVQVTPDGDGKECCTVKLPPGWKGKNIVCILTED